MKPLEKRINLSIPHPGKAEIQYVEEAFKSNWLTTVGPNLDAVEQAFSTKIGRPAVALSSGTAGIHLGLKLLGVCAGDEVVTPTLTFVASCAPICYENALPVLIDSERETWNLDANLLSDFLKKRARTNRMPRVAVVVHLFGQPAKLDEILEICQAYEIPVLEDAAESLGATYKGRDPGSFGEIGVFSFNGNKIITGTTGGLLVARDPAHIERARHWSTQARDPDPAGICNYVHSELGYNYRMSNVIAGIVRGQLEVLETRVQQRRAVFERYREAFDQLDGIEPQPEAWTTDQGRLSPGNAPMENRHSRWLSCFLIDEAKFGMSAADLIRYLDAANIESRPVWRPMHTQPLYQKYECVGGSVAEDLNRRGICLPSSSSLTEEEQQFVIDCVRGAKFVNKR